MVKLTVEINHSGDKTYFAKTLGEEMASDYGMITVALRKTVQTEPYHSTTMGVEVTLPINPDTREAAQDYIEQAYESTLARAEDFLAELEEKVL